MKEESFLSQVREVAFVLSCAFDSSHTRGGPSEVWISSTVVARICQTRSSNRERAVSRKLENISRQAQPGKKGDTHVQVDR